MRMKKFLRKNIRLRFRRSTTFPISTPSTLISRRRRWKLAGKARTAQPADPSVADTFGWALFKQQDYPQALALLQESAEKTHRKSSGAIPPWNGAIHDGPAGCGEGGLRAGFEGPRRFRRQRRSPASSGLVKSRRDQEALPRAALEKLLAEQPVDIVGWMRLGEMYEAEKNLPKAAEAYERARQLNPTCLQPTSSLRNSMPGSSRTGKKPSSSRESRESLRQTILPSRERWARSCCARATINGPIAFCRKRHVGKVMILSFPTNWGWLLTRSGRWMRRARRCSGRLNSLRHQIGPRTQSDFSI